MEQINVYLGIGFLALGLLSLSSYFDNLSPLRVSLFYKELKPMRERWGQDIGTVLHFLGYVVAPLGFGAAFLTGLGF